MVFGIGNRVLDLFVTLCLMQRFTVDILCYLFNNHQPEPEMQTAIVIAGPGKSIVRNNEASVGLTRCVDRTQASWEPKMPHSAAGVLYFECTLCAFMHSSLLRVQEKAPGVTRLSEFARISDFNCNESIKKLLHSYTLLT